MSNKTISPAEQACRDWVRTHGRRPVPVLRAGDRQGAPVRFTYGEPWVKRGKDQEPTAVVWLHPRDLLVNLAELTVHPKAAQMQALAVVDGSSDLYFPPPDCEFCQISLDHDGDGWNCRQCRASWSDNGNDVTRYCVEDACGGAEAAFLGEDGQPRCPSCQFQVVAGDLEPTPPYPCQARYCLEKEVAGMPADSLAALVGRCGRHQDEAERDARLAERS